ncbi:MAG: hypothetical protein HQL12_06905 [Candidatus Omnitrophica bacterium]|nr:hypothetical protein [Candidatus Omnitrophota bacterium]
MNENDQQGMRILPGQNNQAIEKAYQDCVALVRSSIHEKIEKEHVEKTIGLMADIFANDLYNELLRMFYRSSKDNFIYAHIANCMILSIAFATSMGFSRQDIMDIGSCAFGHDFGMMDYLELFQKPVQLTDHEKRSIYQHPQKSAELFRTFFPERVINGILDIHECVNGKGYPKGKFSGEISYLAKVVSVCDIFEALTHVRNFRGEFSPYMAIKMIIQKKDNMFEKMVIKKFVEFMSIYPIGSLVRINTGEIGMVVASNPQYPSRCIVHVLSEVSKELKFSGKIINLLQDPMLYINGVINAGSGEVEG